MSKIEFLDYIANDTVSIKRFILRNPSKYPMIFVAKFFDHYDEDEAYVSLIHFDKKTEKFLTSEDVGFTFNDWRLDDSYERISKPYKIRSKERDAFFRKVEKTLNLLYG